jgi:radical SAM superfamily enzyme YgiQ (UPF0313 family)
MQITLIKPNMGRLAEGPFVDEARMEPLGLGVLAALTPPGVDIRLWDERLDAVDFDEATDLVAITVEAFTARRAYEIADEYRARGVRVVMGGMQATLIPDEVAEHADSVYIGDAEAMWPQVVSDAHEGRLRPRYHAPFGPVQPNGLQPRRDLYHRGGYLPLSLLQFGRGCRFMCEFCAVGAFFCHHHYHRPVAEVVAEVRAQPRRNIFFVDDNIIAEHDEAKELMRALEPLGIHWVSQASVDQVRDPELMDLMAASGCLGNVIGFESLDPDNLAQMHKGQNLSRFDQYAELVAELRRRHLQTWAAFLLGYDHETPESALATCEWAIANKFTFAAFNILTPYPGTPLYERLRDEGRLLYDGRWWLHPDYRFNYAAYRPARMTADELTEAGWQCRQRFNSLSSIARRALEPHTNLASPFRMALYAMYNPLYRKESFKRQGLLLGHQ